MKRRRFTMLLSCLILLALILQSPTATEFAAQGIDQCIRTVIPSLFPFFLISIYLTGNISGGSGLIPLLVSGFLGGYPVGAQSAAESYRSGSISKDTANRLLMFCSQAGPAFLFGIVALQFPDRKYGWILWCIQIVSALSVGALVHIQDNSYQSQQNAAPVSITYAMQKSLRALISVCGWVVIFRILLGFLMILPVNNTWMVLISGLLELSNGCIRLKSVQDPSLRFLIAAIVLNFGGVCVLLQTESVIGSLDVRYYLFGKLMQMCFAVLYCMVFFGYYSAIIPVLVLFIMRIRYKTANNSSIPEHLSV